jgi:hypothetical protein
VRATNARNARRYQSYPYIVPASGYQDAEFNQSWRITQVTIYKDLLSINEQHRIELSARFGASGAPSAGIGLPPRKTVHIESNRGGIRDEVLVEEIPPNQGRSFHRSAVVGPGPSQFRGEHARTGWDVAVNQACVHGPASTVVQLRTRCSSIRVDRAARGSDPTPNARQRFTDRGVAVLSAQLISACARMSM